MVPMDAHRQDDAPGEDQNNGTAWRAIEPGRPVLGPEMARLTRMSDTG